MGFLTIGQRAMVPELMDAPGLDAAAHARALAGLRRLNRASRAAGVMAVPIMKMLRGKSPERISMLDVACGGGDVPVEVATILRGRGVGVDLMLMDKSNTALQEAGKMAAAAGFDVKSALGEAPEGLPEGMFDVVTNSLFLHHLERDQVVETLAEMGKRARRMVVVSDLRRSAMGLAVAWGACRALSGSEIVRHDGPVSVRAAWTMEEMRGMAAEAGLGRARVRGCWPWRMLLVWERAGELTEGVKNGGME